MENLYRQAFDKIKTKLFTTDSYSRRVGLGYCLQLSNFTVINSSMLVTLITFPIGE